MTKLRKYRQHHKLGNGQSSLNWSLNKTAKNGYAPHGFLYANSDIVIYSFIHYSFILFVSFIRVGVFLSANTVFIKNTCPSEHTGG